MPQFPPVEAQRKTSPGTIIPIGKLCVDALMLQRTALTSHTKHSALFWAALIVVAFSGAATAMATFADDGGIGFLTRGLIAIVGWWGLVVGVKVALLPFRNRDLGDEQKSLALALGIAHMPLLLRPAALLTTADPLIALILFAWQVAISVIAISVVLDNQGRRVQGMVAAGAGAGYFLALAASGIVFLG
jgi:hypothetical protein